MVIYSIIIVFFKIFIYNQGYALDYTGNLKVFCEEERRIAEKHYRLAADQCPAAQASLESLKDFFSQDDSIPTYSTMNDVYKRVCSALVGGSIWLIMDIDYVLIAPKDVFGRPKGQIVCQSLLKKMNLPKEVEIKLVERMMTEMDYSLVEGVSDLIQMIEDNKNIRCLALTRMALGMEKNGLEWRVSQLQKLGIELHSKEDGEIINWDKSAGYYKGVIRSGMNPKGKALAYYMREFMEKIGKPKKIIFVDNNRWYVRSVRNTCRRSKIDFLGIHFVNEVFERDPQPLHEIIKYQIGAILKTGHFITYQQAILEAEDLESPNYTPEEQNLYESWERFSKNGCKKSADFLIKQAQEGDHMAQAYAACVYQQGGVVRQDTEISKLYAEKCCNFLKSEECNNSAEAKYIVAHMIRKGIWNGSLPTTVSSSNPLTAIPIIISSSESSLRTVIITPKVASLHTSFDTQLPRELLSKNSPTQQQSTSSIEPQ